MKNKKKFAALAILPVLGLGAFATLALAETAPNTGAGSAVQAPADFASRTTQMFQSQADLLGASLDEVKQAWAEGKSLQELATSKGISADTLKQKMQAQRLEKEKSMLSTLVAQGVITQAQADTRLAAIQNGTVKGGFGRFHGGPRGGFGF